jgi:hypothetical protein
MDCSCRTFREEPLARPVCLFSGTRAPYRRVMGRAGPTFTRRAIGGGRNLIVLDAGDVLHDAFAIRCPRIDAEGEVSSRRGHLHLLPASSEREFCQSSARRSWPLFLPITAISFINTTLSELEHNSDRRPTADVKSGPEKTSAPSRDCAYWLA